MLTILKEENSKIVVNRSKFLGFIFPCSNEEQRDVILASFKKEYFMATHICFAHIFWNGKEVINFSSDDREPSGTAGVQILNAIKENNLVNALCVVVRFFGGVKLGVQNLSKAYKQCTLDAILKAQTKQIELKTKCLFECDYNTFNKISKLIPNLKNSVTNFDNIIKVEIMLNEEEIKKVSSLVLQFVKTEEKSYC